MSRMDVERKAVQALTSASPPETLAEPSVSTPVLTLSLVTSQRWKFISISFLATEKSRRMVTEERTV